MSDLPIVDTPAGFVTQQVLALGAPGEAATPVAAGNPLPVAERPLSGSLTFVPGGTDAPPRRALRISCTAAGNVAMKLADDSVETIPVDVGLSILPYAV